MSASRFTQCYLTAITFATWEGDRRGWKVTESTGLLATNGSRGFHHGGRFMRNLRYTLRFKKRWEAKSLESIEQLFFSLQEKHEMRSMCDFYT